MEAHNETMATYFYDQPSTSQRRNRYIYPASALGSLHVFKLPELFSRTGFFVSASSYVYPGMLFSQMF